MEEQIHDALDSKPRVKATFHLGSETYAVNSDTGTLSQQLAAMKEESMGILKDYITRHNVPNDVPDEVVESSSEEEEVKKPSKKSKKQETQ